jgi:hypothetical protein
MNAVRATNFGQGADLDAAVLASTNFNQTGPSQKLSLSF